MLRKYVQPVLAWFKQAVTEPRHELDRWEASVRYAYDLGIHGWKALTRDRAPQMAAALSFRTLFALFPVLVVSTIVVKTLQGPDQFLEIARNLFGAWGLYDIKMLPPAQTVAGDAAATVNVGLWMEDIVREAASASLSAAGSIGLIIVVYSAIGLMVTIENSFNMIYGAPAGRSWMWRVLVYWAVLTLGPLFLGAAFYVDSAFGRFIDGFSPTDAGGASWGMLLTGVKFFWGFAVAWLFMFTMYRLIPHTKVNSKAALAGSFVTAVFLVCGRASLTAYFSNAVSLKNFYGSLGSIPLVMFWVYVMWLLVLFGLEVSATIQSLQGRTIEELEEKRPQNGLVDPASVLPVMDIVRERFDRAQPVTAREISEETLIAESIVCQMLDRLVQKGFLHRLDREDGAVSLARPASDIVAAHLIEIGFSLVDEGGTLRPSPLIARLRDVQRRVAQRVTLATIAVPRPPEAQPDPALAVKSS